MTKQAQDTNQDEPQDTGALTQDQERTITKLVSRIGKRDRPAYQGARSYQMLPEEAA